MIELIILILLLIAIIVGLIIYVVLDFTKSQKHVKHHIVGGCVGTRWGCCPDGITPRMDPFGTNCMPKNEELLDNMFISQN